MKKVLLYFFCLFLLLIASVPAHSQSYKKKTDTQSQTNDIDTPRKRKKSRTNYQSEDKIKIKKSRNYIKKKTKDNEYKVKVSGKSNEVPIVIDNSKSKIIKKDKPVREIRKSKSKSEKMSTSEGRHQYKKREKKSVVNESVTQTVKSKTPKEKKKLKERQGGKIVESEGPLKIKPEEYRKRPGTIYKDDPKGGSRYKSQAEEGSYTYKTKGSKKRKEQQEEKTVDSKGPVGVTPEPYRKRPGTIYSEDKKGGSKYKSQGEEGAFTYKTKGFKKKRKEKERKEERIVHSDGPVGITPDPYRKRPGTIYSEDKKGGSKYKSQGEKGSFTFKTNMTPEKREKKIAKRSKERALYDGDIKVAKKSREMHPSAAYLNAKRIGSLEEKEKRRKKELRKSRGRNSGQPKIVTEKRKKPKYDTRESEIWYE